MQYALQWFADTHLDHFVVYIHLLLSLFQDMHNMASRRVELEWIQFVIYFVLYSFFFIIDF